MRTHLLLCAGLLLSGLAAGSTAAQRPPRATVFSSVSYVRSDGYYSEYYPPDIDVFYIGNELATLTLGGEVPVMQRAAFTGWLGGSLAITRSRALIEGSRSGEGVDPQHLDLYARVTRGAVSATVGFTLDLGPNPVAYDSVAGPDQRYFTSDAQHAVYVGVEGETARGPVRLSGGLAGFVTFPLTYDYAFSDGNEIQAIDATVDQGDTYLARAGAAYPIGIAEVGLDALFTYMTPYRFTADFPPGTPVFVEPDLEGQWLLSLAPRVTLASPGLPVQLELAVRAPAATWYAEHAPVGITVAGHILPKVRLPLSLSARVAL